MFFVRLPLRWSYICGALHEQVETAGRPFIILDALPQPPTVVVPESSVEHHLETPHRLTTGAQGLTRHQSHPPRLVLDVNERGRRVVVGLDREVREALAPHHLESIEVGIEAPVVVADAGV